MDFPGNGPWWFRHSLLPEDRLTKAELRKELRAKRRAHVASLPENMRGLVFRRPPGAVAQLIPAGSTVGVYAEAPDEASASGYARWLYEAGHPIALPWFAARDERMSFRLWDNPFDDDALEPGPWGMRQADASAATADPQVVFVPLVGFTASGARLGMGAGHYDRWLAAHPDVLSIGLAWDCQEVVALPLKPHDRPLDAIVTPTRLLGPFA